MHSECRTDRAKEFKSYAQHRHGGLGVTEADEALFLGGSVEKRTSQKCRSSNSIEKQE